MKWLVKRKAIYCGRNCRSCPHGHYFYGFAKVNGRTKSKYLGKEPPTGMYESGGKFYVGYKGEDLPPLPEMPTLFIPDQAPPSTRPSTITPELSAHLLYNDACITLGLGGTEGMTREQVRKRTFNLCAPKTATHQERETYKIAFTVICRHNQWKLPKN